MTTTPRNEQEVIITYDRELDEWHYYGDCPPLNRKWRDLVDAKQIEVEPTGIISLLEGTVTGKVNINRRPAKREYTDEERKRMSDQFKANMAKRKQD